MDTNFAYALLVIAFGLGALVYRWYMRVTAPESEGGKDITMKEFWSLLDDPDFRKFISDLIDEWNKQKAEENAVPK